MPEFLTFVAVALIIYFIAKKYTRKEAKQYVEENPEPKEAQNIDTVDIMAEVLVEFVFLSKKDQFMINSYPNIMINNVDKYKMLDDKLTLKLPPKFTLHFGVPYMNGEAFKYNETYTFSPGKRYKISFKPKAFVFSKPKVTVEELGMI
ncbi:hypothetical protein RJI07_02905 [Mycoplasmatota bacterium WC30]